MKPLFYFSVLILLVNSCSSSDKSGSSKLADSSLVDSISRLSANRIWLGSWERRQWRSGAALEIKNIESDSIAFSLVAFNGIHEGEIEGKASVKNRVAIFINSGVYDSCLIEFRLINDTSIIIEQKKGLCLAGMGVTYDGEYKNSKMLPKEEKAETMLSLGVFKTIKEDSLFESLVKVSYKLFVYSTQTTAEIEDLDSLHSRVISSGVTGLYSIQENIVMIDSLGNIWAAVLNKEKVHYFSNNNRFKNKLPKTIDNWRQRFQDYPVIFK